VVDLKYFQNYRPFTSHKTTGEDPLEVEDSLEVEDFLEVEDSQEEADTQAEVEYHLEDHPEEAGDHRRFLCPKPNKENR